MQRLAEMQTKLEAHESSGNKAEAAEVKKEIKKGEKQLKLKRKQTIRLIKKTRSRPGLNPSTKRFLFESMNRPEYPGTFI